MLAMWQLRSPVLSLPLGAGIMASSPHTEGSSTGRGTGKGWHLQPQSQQRAVAHLTVFCVGKKLRHSVAGISKRRISLCPSTCL